MGDKHAFLLLFFVSLLTARWYRHRGMRSLTAAQRDRWSTDFVEYRRFSSLTVAATIISMLVIMSVLPADRNLAVVIRGVLLSSLAGVSVAIRASQCRSRGLPPEYQRSELTADVLVMAGAVLGFSSLPQL